MPLKFILRNPLDLKPPLVDVMLGALDGESQFDGLRIGSAAAAFTYAPWQGFSYFEF
jgi:hypothetical protein